uniref:Methyltransferase domain-containing protein n=1 Tax=Craspedostauros australis TaxID=1486917 RepID=A0A7R9ZIG8_9STRA|mmetsp:Transcript_1246/g.3590  ORF Transcript_1246/g.3590 Transcript_1246/m.3590 type:complete len:254 (+) Transcript_1246:119-880(+)
MTIPQYPTTLLLRTPNQIHVELGSGDGRVNFFAAEYGAKKSVGIDVDEDIVKVAKDRLLRIHPQPNIEFVVADLMDRDHPAWGYIDQATIITMYFATEGLVKLRPLLEQRLKGRRCKVLTCGYTMPGWDHQMAETVLDIPIHFYDWGNDEIANFFNDNIIDEVPQEFEAAQLDQYLRTKKEGSTFRPDPLPGFHPDDLIDIDDDDDWGEPRSSVATTEDSETEQSSSPFADGQAVDEKASVVEQPDLDWKPNK